jgi:hypothetical protein
MIKIRIILIKKPGNPTDLTIRSVFKRNVNMENPVETYFIAATPYVPGSELPVLVYRAVLSHCRNEDEIKTCLEANGGWEKGV